MKRFENIDLIDSLYKIMLTNTFHYQEDFKYDKELIREAAESKNAADKNLLFMSRPSGTYCFRDTEVFKKNTAQYNTWKFYGEQTHDRILAYAIKITGIQNDIIKGNLYELDYQEHFKHVINTAVEADIQTLHYKHGDLDLSMGKWFPAGPHPEYGDFLGCEVKPNNPEKLKLVLEGEHRSNEKLRCGDIDKHIADLTDRAVKSQLNTMSAVEKQELIDKVEICRDYNDLDAITPLDFALYEAVTAQRAKEKPSVRKQLAENKAKSEPKKSITPKKEDISL